jgi:hypothetical protein
MDLDVGGVQVTQFPNSACVCEQRQDLLPQARVIPSRPARVNTRARLQSEFE